MEEIHAHGDEGHTRSLHAKDDGPFAAHVFKTLAEPHVGDVSYFRVLSGKVVSGQDVFNATRDGTEKLAHLSIPCGRERTEASVLHAGDIGCVTKLRNTHTNDTLSTREHPVRLPAITFPEPLVHFAVRATARGDEEKLQQGLHRLHDEDPTFETHYNPETHETIVGGMGERHLDVSMAVLAEDGVQASSRAAHPFRERSLEGEGHGCTDSRCRGHSATAGSACTMPRGKATCSHRIVGRDPGEVHTRSTAACRSGGAARAKGFPSSTSDSSCTTAQPAWTRTNVIKWRASSVQVGGAEGVPVILERSTYWIYGADASSATCLATSPAPRDIVGTDSDYLARRARASRSRSCTVLHALSLVRTPGRSRAVQRLRAGAGDAAARSSELRENGAVQV